jgi:chromosome segregation ATPase
LRQEGFRRSTLLAKEQRVLAERALALEQYRQQCIARAANPRAAEKRLERLRRRWAALGVSAERRLAQERKSLETQAARLEERARQVQHDLDELTAQEAELSTGQAAWERQQLQDRQEKEKIRQELHSLRRQRHSYEQQLAALHEEVECLARLLLDDNEPASRPVVQAA